MDNRASAPLSASNNLNPTTQTSSLNNQSSSVVSQGKIIAESLEAYLKRHQSMSENCSQNSSRVFFTTRDVVDFNAHASLFFGAEIQAKKLILP